MWFYGVALVVIISVIVTYLLNNYVNWKARHWFVISLTWTGVWFLNIKFDN